MVVQSYLLVGEDPHRMLDLQTLQAQSVRGQQRAQLVSVTARAPPGKNAKQKSSTIQHGVYIRNAESAVLAIN